jgi:hypothetical protein
VQQTHQRPSSSSSSSSSSSTRMYGHLQQQALGALQQPMQQQQLHYS